MDTFLNVLGLFFLLSGVAAWFFAIMLFIFYRLCLHPQEEE